MTLKKDANFEEKLSFCLKNDIRGIWWTLTGPAESLKICSLMGDFCRNYVVLELKKNTEELCHEKWYNDISNLVNFHTSSWKLNTLYIMFYSWRNVFFEQIFWNFQCLPKVVQIPHMILETRSQFLYKLCTIF